MQLGHFSDIVALGAALAINEYLFRFGLSLYELVFKSRHYHHEAQIRTVFEYAYHQTSLSKILSVFFVIAGAMLNKEGLLKMMLLTLVVYIPLRVTNYQKSLIDCANFIREGSGLDYGTGLANNYYHGYLKHLTDKGGDIKGIRLRLEQYESDERVKVPVKRLFILVPYSLHSKPNFSDPPKIEAVKSLESISFDRAGIKKRVYTTGMYRMVDEETDEPWYVAVEGATPLLSFLESLNEHPLTITWVTKKMEREIAVQFYKTLKKISESRNLKHDPVFEIIPYTDILPNGKANDISAIVKRRIRKMIREGLD